MSRPVTLYTGQWADLPIEKLCQKAKSFGYDGLELACWGDHFEVNKANDTYCRAKRKLLDKYGLRSFQFQTTLLDKQFQIASMIGIKTYFRIMSGEMAYAGRCQETRC